MKTLLYLASGEFFSDYKDLPFDRMIFVDRSPSYQNTYPENDKRIKFIGADALIAIDILKKENIKIDCLVSINEGLFDGGGSYPIFSGFLMGYLSPILRDEITLICNLKYYSGGPLATPMGKLDWGFEKISELTPRETNYVDPSLFSYSQRLVKKDTFGNVFLMRRTKKTTQIQTQNSRVNTQIIHGSIWDDEFKLDLLGLNLISEFEIRGRRSQGVRNTRDFFISKPKVFNLMGLDFKEILEHCDKKKLNNIGLCPWNQGNYEDVVDSISDYKGSNIKSITFYHLNKKDFRSLYERA